MNISFDPKCLELAEYFLPDAPKARQCRLAQVIQDTVEGFDFAAPTEQANKPNVYRLYRYRNGVQMAEGARVRATSEEEAKAKAAKLFYEHGDEYLPWYPERFEVQSVEQPHSTTEDGQVAKTCARFEAKVKATQSIEYLARIEYEAQMINHAGEAGKRLRMVKPAATLARVQRALRRELANGRH